MNLGKRGMMKDEGREWVWRKRVIRVSKKKKTDSKDTSCQNEEEEEGREYNLLSSLFPTSSPPHGFSLDPTDLYHHSDNRSFLPSFPPTPHSFPQIKLHNGHQRREGEGELEGKGTCSHPLVEIYR